MPRKLPWLQKQVAKPAPAPVPRRKRSSSPIVNSDLDDLDDAPRPRQKKKNKALRELSSSPPPPTPREPPPIEYMKEGLDGDDKFMMVEDEFYSTAQLFTHHIHHAEYVRLKKLHRSRGRDTLAQLQRGTDNGRTEQSKQLRIKLEAEENRKKQDEMRKLAYGDDNGSDEDEFMDDPQLAGLMTGSQMSASQNLAKARLSALTAAGAGSTSGSLQSPHNLSRTRNTLAAASGSKSRPSSAFASVEEEDDDEVETDSDDLDARPAKSNRSAEWADRPALNTTRSSIEQEDSRTSMQAYGQIIPKQFARAAPLERKPVKQESPSSIAWPRSRVKAEPQSSPMRPIKAESRYASLFNDDPPELPCAAAAQQEAEQAKKDAEKRKAAEDSIPTFLF